ncbi:MAG: hypothetical protein ACHP7P_05860 [Terriglobales bacterium]
MDQRVANRSDDVRSHAERQYIRRARARGEKRFSIVVGEVHKALHLDNRVPLVCAALKSKKFLRQNGIRLIGVNGPPSGQSTTVTLTYEFEDPASPTQGNALVNARGIAREVFRSLGGGEAFIRAERAAFAAAVPPVADAERESK